MIGSQTSQQRATLPEWTIREASGEHDAFYLARLWHHWFGGEYVSQEELPVDLFHVAGWELDDDSEHKLPLASHAVIAEHNPSCRDGTVTIGAGLSCLFGRERIQDELPDGRFETTALVGERNGFMLFGVVDEKFRGEGIGRRLFNERMEWLREIGADMAFGFCWQRDGRTSRKLFETHEFVPIQEFPEQYAETRSSCPECGIWPTDDASCSCSAMLYAKDMPTDKNQVEDHD